SHFEIWKAEASLRIRQGGCRDVRFELPGGDLSSGNHTTLRIGDAPGDAGIVDRFLCAHGNNGRGDTTRHDDQTACNKQSHGSPPFTFPFERRQRADAGATTTRAEARLVRARRSDSVVVTERS